MEPKVETLHLMCFNQGVFFFRGHSLQYLSKFLFKFSLFLFFVFFFRFVSFFLVFHDVGKTLLFFTDYNRIFFIFLLYSYTIWIFQYCFKWFGSTTSLFFNNINSTGE